MENERGKGRGGVMSLKWCLSVHVNGGVSVHVCGCVLAGVRLVLQRINPIESVHESSLRIETQNLLGKTESRVNKKSRN